MARRYLQMSRAEWEALPWCDQRAYVEGFEHEGLLETGEAAGGGDGTDPLADVLGDASWR